jgi:two-component system cell cycle sensor histidine kinase/response regulator CckA
VALDLTLAVRYCNPAFAAMCRRSVEELTGEILPDVLPAFAPSKARLLCEQVLLQGHAREAEVRLGERRLLMRVHPVADGVFALLADVSPQQLADENDPEQETVVEPSRLQESLRQAQKLESLGVLVGGVAHDFNNLLIGMLNGAELLLRELPPNSPLRGTADVIRKASLRARGVAQQLLVFVGKEQALRQTLDVNLLIRDTLSLLESAFGNVAVETALAEDLPSIHADPAQMQQVVLNLLMNAAEALPTTGGTIRVATGLKPSPLSPPQEQGARGRSEWDLPAGDYLFVEVADNGPGMSPEVQTRVFEPFFTTKPSGHGLGLATVKHIVRTANGAIRVNSVPGEGSSFCVYLPCPRPTATATPAAGSVLIVDDEPFVRDVLSRLLAKAGFATRCASNGPEAIGQVREHPEIELVVLDLRMPGMDGWEALAAIRAVRPRMQAILSSGFADADLMKHGDARVVGFLPKPYVFADMLRLVQQGLARPAG